MIKAITEADEKEKITENILCSLPEWFGIRESRDEYIRLSRKLPYWAAIEDGKPVGFIALKETGPYTAEICVMGILREYHRKGIGHQLFAEFHKYAKEKGYRFIHVKTVEAGYFEVYDRTRMFYESLGFCKLECFPLYWDEWNPCLVMVRTV